MKTAKELCACINRERHAQADQRRPRFSTEVKRAVSEYVSDARSRGVSESQLISDLGIGPASLIRWCGRRSEPSAFRQVVMVQAAAQAPAESSSREPRVIVGRNKATVAIIGLTVPELVELCRSLGC